MKDHLERSKLKDIDEARDITKQALWPHMYRSYLEEISNSVYFPVLCPELSGCFYEEVKASETYKYDPDKYQDYIEFLQKYCTNPASNPDFSIIQVPYDSAVIKEITDYNQISLFEVALLIGYRIDKDPRLILFTCPDLFTDAIVNKLIDPRDPLTFIPYSKLHKSARLINGVALFTKDMPDLSWQLTLKEAAEFAILKGYPEYLFSDLLNDTEKPNNEDSEPSGPTNEEQSISPPHHLQKRPILTKGTRCLVLNYLLQLRHGSMY